MFLTEFYNTLYQKFRIDINVNNMEGEIYGISVVRILSLTNNTIFQMNFMDF